MTDWVYQPAHRQMDAMRAGRITSVGLLEAHFERFQSANPALNAVIRTDIERARERANALDGLRREGREIGPLHGLPMTVKDTLDVDTMPATAGAPQYAARAKPVVDAVTVARARAAGAVIWGKTNTPFLAGDWQSDNPVFGATSNPHDLTRTCGGSSGGAAAALAAGITPLEIGSDIGGSLRIPAAYCGVVSLKPTWGVIPQAGHVPPRPGFAGEVDLNVVGPMARSVRDLKLLRSALMRGATGGASVPLNLEGVKLAYGFAVEGFALSSAVETVLNEAVNDLRGSNAEMSPALPELDFTELRDVYLSLLAGIIAMDFPRGQLAAMTALRPFFHLLRAFGKAPYTRANWALKSTARHVDWLQADGRRAAFKAIMRGFFKKHDALILPVSPVAAFPHMPRGDLFSRRLDVDGQATPYPSHLDWICLASACHLPVVTLLAGRTPDGLPVGLQLIGGQGEDAKLLDIAEAVESHLSGFRKPVPPFDT